MKILLFGFAIFATASSALSSVWVPFHTSTPSYDSGNGMLSLDSTWNAHGRSIDASLGIYTWHTGGSTTQSFQGTAASWSGHTFTNVSYPPTNANVVPMGHFSWEPHVRDYEPGGQSPLDLSFSEPIDFEYEIYVSYRLHPHPILEGSFQGNSVPLDISTEQVIDSQGVLLEEYLIVTSDDPIDHIQITGSLSSYGRFSVGVATIPEPTSMAFVLTSSILFFRRRRGVLS